MLSNAWSLYCQMFSIAETFVKITLIILLFSNYVYHYVIK